MNKKISDWELFQRFFEYVRPHWKSLSLGIMAIPFSIVATLLLPWILIRIVDNYIVPGNLDGLFKMVTIMAITVAIGYSSDSIYTFTLQKIGQLAINSMRSDLYFHILSMPRSFFDKKPIGVILTRLTSDMEALNDSLAIGVLSLFTDFIKTIALLIFLIILSWELTLILIIILPPIYFLSNFLRRRLRYYFNLTREALAEATGFLQECLNGVKTIQLYASEKKVQKRFEKKTMIFFDAQTKSNLFDAALFSIIEGITSIALALMIWHGSQQILAEIVTIGVLIGFINILNRIFIPIREFTQQISILQRSLSSLENIEKLFIEIPEENISTSKKQNFEAEKISNRLKTFEKLSFENVHFRYSKNGPWVLNGISFTVNRGDRLAIIGFTGSGKSTIVRILTKTYINYEGSIKINGIELKNIPRNQLIKMISIMPQESYLFEESIAFNIALNNPNITMESIKKASKYVFANEFIEKIPEKYNFKLLEGGKNISEGQARLLVFARALAENNDFIVLDEATSSVDSITENLIQKAIERIFQDKTVIAIAHRLNTIKNSDFILVLEEGNIVEQGSHKKLYNRNGIYTRFVKSLKEGINSNNF